MVYKVEVLPGVINTEEGPKIQKMINELEKDGWKLQSVTPQVQDGSTVCNMFIFKKGS